MAQETPEGVREAGVRLARECVAEAGLRTTHESAGWKEPSHPDGVAIYEIRHDGSWAQCEAVRRAWCRKMRGEGRFEEALAGALVALSGTPTAEEEAELESWLATPLLGRARVAEALADVQAEEAA